MSSLFTEYVEFIPSFDALTMFYANAGNAMVEIGYFDPEPMGVVMLEHSQDGGRRWGPVNGTKLTRNGMMTNCTAGAAIFRVALDGAMASGFRVRCRETREMQPIQVKVTFGGKIALHRIRSESKYVITETPDIRDL